MTDVDDDEEVEEEVAVRNVVLKKEPKYSYRGGGDFPDEDAEWVAVLHFFYNLASLTPLQYTCSGVDIRLGSVKALSPTERNMHSPVYKVEPEVATASLSDFIGGSPAAHGGSPSSGKTQDIYLFKAALYHWKLIIIAGDDIDKEFDDIDEDVGKRGKRKRSIFAMAKNKMNSMKNKAKQKPKGKDKKVIGTLETKHC